MFPTTVVACYVVLFLQGVAPIFADVHSSTGAMCMSSLAIISVSMTAAKRERKRLSDGDDAEERDFLDRHQTYRFQLVASCALLGMFLAFKNLSKETVSFLLTLYGVTFGGLALSGVVGSELPAVFFKELGLRDFGSFIMFKIFGIAAAFTVTYWYCTTKAWVPQNILASAQALCAINMLAIPDFHSAAVLLCGLFFYDILGVFDSKSAFCSSFTVFIAKQFEGPIRLVFPRFVGVSSKAPFILMLGDVIILGLFVAFMLRFDLRKVGITAAPPLSLPFFYGAVAAYVLGLMATYVALAIFDAERSTLAYLVPSCMLVVMAISFIKEFKELMHST